MNKLEKIAYVPRIILYGILFILFLPLFAILFLIRIVFSSLSILFLSNIAFTLINLLNKTLVTIHPTMNYDNLKNTVLTKLNNTDDI